MANEKDSERFFVHELPNGMTLLGEHMEQVSSVAMSLAVCAGSSLDPAGCEGAAAVAAEWCIRGAGDRDTRQLNEALDSLGCHHVERVLSRHTMFSAALLGRNLAEVLGIYADIVRRPRLDDASFAPSRALVQQDLASLEDEPARKCNLLLRERFYPHPLGRCVYGTAESLQALTPQAVRDHVAERFTPGECILAVAGNFDRDRLRDLAERHFGDWPATPAPAPQITPSAGGVTHVRKGSAQVHITLAYPAAVMSDGRYYAARLAGTVLSGGMSSRLMTEVREKRGLVYHVSASYHSLKDHAGTFVYAGTVPEKAQETLELVVAELRRLGEGIEDHERSRAVTQLKSALIMQGESTSARANALAGDFYHLRRLRSLGEISRAIEAVGAGDVQAYLHDFPAANFTALIIGPEPLDTGALEK